MPPRQPRSLAELLQHSRRTAGLSMERLADASGVNASQISRIESGESTEPTAETLNRLARALDVDPEDFYDAAWQQIERRAALPSVPTYLRSKLKLSRAEAEQVEAFIDDLKRQKRAKRTK